jgi:hypothetical protein
MTKLIKPEKIDDIIRSGVVLTSRKAYQELKAYYIGSRRLKDMCSVRDEHCINNFAYTVSCKDVANCNNCFLNANNYLNVLKYIKRNKINFTYVYRSIESIY